MLKMQKKINGEMLVREFPERNIVGLKKNGWKIFTPAKKKKNAKPA